eukprot:6203771-Pleurochrysis_carterae.AAC.1
MQACMGSREMCFDSPWVARQRSWLRTISTASELLYSVPFRAYVQPETDARNAKKGFDCGIGNVVEEVLMATAVATAMATAVAIVGPVALAVAVPVAMAWAVQGRRQ